MLRQRTLIGTVVAAVGIVMSVGVVLGACSTSPRETSRVLVHDRKNGGRAIEPAIALGDEIVAPLREESRDFAELDNRNSERVARVLGAIRTPASRDLATELAGRDDLRARLVGVAGLAAQSALPRDDDTDAFLEDAALGRLPAACHDILHESDENSSPGALTSRRSQPIAGGAVVAMCPE